MLFGIISLLFGISGLFSRSAGAADYNFSHSTLSLNGFLTATAAKILTSNKYDSYFQYNCPCTIANYEYGGMYNGKKWDAQPESLFGIQASLSTKNQFLSGTIQLVTRGANNFNPDLDWYYLTYRLNENWSFQAGHKRLPQYYYSDFMYVGFAYPWVRPPIDLYGWQIYSYNGVNLLYKGIWGEWATMANIWTGRQSDRHNKMWKNIYGSDINETWRRIVGIYLDLNKNDIYNLRLIHMQNYIDRFTFYEDGTVENDPNNIRQIFYGLSFNIDAQQWLLRSEVNYFQQPKISVQYLSYLIGLGIKHRQFTALATYSKFREYVDFLPDIQDTRSFTLRWDLSASSALKLQYDIYHDKSGYPFVGNSKSIATSFVMTF